MIYKLCSTKYIHIHLEQTSFASLDQADGDDENQIALSGNLHHCPLIDGLMYHTSYTDRYKFLIMKSRKIQIIRKMTKRKSSKRHSGTQNFNIY